MRSRVLANLIVAMVVGCALGCGSSPTEPTEPGRYVNNVHGYSIKFPLNWERDEDAGSTDVAAYSPAEGVGDPFRESVYVSIVKLSDPATLRAYMSRWFAGSSAVLNGFQELERGTETIAFFDAEWVVFDYYFEPPGSRTVPVRELAFVLMKDSYTVFWIQCLADPSEFTDYRPQFAEIARSFRFE